MSYPGNPRETTALRVQPSFYKTILLRIPVQTNPETHINKSDIVTPNFYFIVDDRRFITDKNKNFGFFWHTSRGGRPRVFLGK